MEFLKQISDTEYTIECSYIHTVTVLNDGTKIIKLNAYSITDMGNDQIDSEFERIEYKSNLHLSPCKKCAFSSAIKIIDIIRPKASKKELG